MHAIRVHAAADLEVHAFKTFGPTAEDKGAITYRTFGLIHHHREPVLSFHRRGTVLISDGNLWSDQPIAKRARHRFQADRKSYELLTTE